jgi:hypothetical protein
MSNANIPIRNTEEQKNKVLKLLNAIKQVTKKPHIYNLIEALTKYKESIRNGQK